MVYVLWGWHIEYNEEKNSGKIISDVPEMFSQHSREMSTVGKRITFMKLGRPKPNVIIWNGYSVYQF